MAVLTADDVMAWRFQTTMLRAGYDQGVVDILLDRVVDALRAREAQAGDDPGTLAGILTSQEVRATRLPCGRFRQGYLKEQIDALMAQIAATLKAYEEHTRGSAPL
ncbi:MAG: DivIVA domain-containing protein [Actinomyces bowdenii]|nr:DivIVA domain-containing protein [Actinomyces bowdenii]